MNILDAAIELKHGKSIKRRKWNSNASLVETNAGLRVKYCEGASNTVLFAECSFELGDVLADDWEVVE